MKYKEMNVPLYNFPLTVVLTNSWGEINKKFDTLIDDKPLYCAAAFGTRNVKATRNGKTKIIRKDKCVYLAFHETGLFSIEDVTHEATHAKNFLFESLGIKPDVDNDEAEAYLLGGIAQQVYDFLKKEKKLKS